MIIIAGSGIVGLAASLHLAKNCGLEVTVLQGDSPDISYSSQDSYHHRVSALTLKSIAFLEQLGVWPHIAAKRISPLKDMFVFAEFPKFQLHFSHRDVYADQLGCIVENDLIVHALQEEIAETPTIHCVRESFVSAKISSLIHVKTDKPRKISADLLLAADGADSFVRSFFHIPVQEKNYQQMAITTTVETDTKHHARAMQQFFSDEILGFLPLAQANLYSLVWSLNTGQAKIELEKNDEDFIAALTARMQNQLGKITAVGMRHAFPLKRQRAEHYCQTGVVLLGDALHRVHPLAGQGVNLAFKDIEVLSDVLKHKKKNYALGDVHVLNAFQRQAKSAHLPMCMAIDVLKTIFATPNWTKRFIISPGLAGLNHLTLVKRCLIQAAM